MPTRNDSQNIYKKMSSEILLKFIDFNQADVGHEFSILCTVKPL